MESSDVESVELLLEGVEVRTQLSRSVAIDSNEAVVGSLLRELIDHTTRQDIGHKRAVKHRYLCKYSRSWDVASVFRKEYWNGSVGKLSI